MSATPLTLDQLQFFTNLLPTLIGLGTALGGLIGVLATAAYNRRKLRLDRQKMDLDDSTQLRKDLIEERKAILSQLLEERNYFTDRLNRLEDSSKEKVQELENRIRTLEDENNAKDVQILSQKKQIDEQALKLHVQTELIKALQEQVTALKGRAECKYDPENCPHGTESHS
jgi:gas vesicle protein